MGFAWGEDYTHDRNSLLDGITWEDAIAQIKQSRKESGTGLQFPDTDKDWNSSDFCEGL